MKHILVILNPAAKGERARHLKEKIKSLAPHLVVRETRNRDDAKVIAKSAVDDGFHTIVAAGGDGTINEVVNGMAESDVRLGILPVGTMNVFAMELGLPLNDLEAAWKVIEQGHVRKIDLPKANNEYFVQLAGVGLDAEVVQSTTPESKKALGPLSYVLSLAQVSFKEAPEFVVKTGEGDVRQGRFILIGNGRYYGGQMVLFQDARLDDGRLDVVLFKNRSPWDIIRYCQAILFGTHFELPDVEYFQASSLDVSGDQEIPVELDGELAGRLPCKFGFSEKKLSVFVAADDS